MEFDVSIFDELILSDDLEPNFKVETLEDTLSFVEGVFSNIQYLQISEQLTFSESYTFGGIHNVAITDSITFTDAAQPRVWVLGINDFLFMYDVLDLPLGGVIVEQLDFVDVATGETCTPLTPDVLTFTDGVSLQFLPHKTNSDTISFADSMSVALINALAPSTTVGYVPPTVEPHLTFTDTTGQTITLRLPDFQDSDTVTYTRINRTSRGFTPIIIGVAGWLPKKARKMTFTYLQEKDTIMVRAFFRKNAGLPVTLVDIYGDVRSVICQNPEFEVAQVGRENRTLTLDLYVL